MSPVDEIEDSSAPLIEHLAELRTRLIRSVLAFVAGMVICFTVWNPIFDFLTRPLCTAMAVRGQEDCGLILIALFLGSLEHDCNKAIRVPVSFGCGANASDFNRLKL